MESLALERYAPALKLLVSFLSYGVVCGSCVLKLPQILKIFKSGSSEGVSLSGILIELLAYAISLSWGIRQKLSFSDFGENAVVFVQMCILVMVVSNYQKAKGKAFAFCVCVLCVLVGLINDTIPVSFHRKLLSGQIFLSLLSRVPQIMANYRAHSTGQLSFLTFFMAFSGGLARFLTTAMNVSWGKGKGVLLCQYALSVFLSFILLLQMFLYRNFKKKRD